MSKAEERALEVYPRSEKYTTSQRLIMNDLRDGFIHGYEQAEKDIKEQMLREAVEADVNIYRDLVAGKSWAEFVVEMPTKNLGDKVKIIIVKED